MSMSKFACWVVNFAAMAMMLGVEGCRNETSLRNRPDAKEIVGTWSLVVAESDWRPNDEDVAEHVVTLKSDGTATVKGIPDVWNADNRLVKGAYESGTGFWRCKAEEGVWVVELDLKEVNGRMSRRSRTLPLIGQEPPYLIRLSIGDPDLGHRLVFRKDSTKNSK